jgi:hypothetical protein
MKEEFVDYETAHGVITMSKTPPTIAMYKETVTPEKISAGYMVSVDGNTAPRKVHETIDDAKQEAERLSKSQNGKIIRVMMLVGVYEPSHTWRELV